MSALALAPKAAARLALAPNLELPAASAGTQTYGFVARKGGGKSYAASKLAELLFAAGVPVIVIDPVGIWWGLRRGADGVSEGLRIPVIGGRNGDVPLGAEEGLGERLALWLIGGNGSAVIDVSELRKAERRRFVTEFAENFFHAAKGKRRPRMLVLEEAQAFAPQLAKGQERMLGAMEDIVRLGRNYGIGAMLVTQRPQSVNKEVLNQVECLFVGQLPAKHERDAVRGWIVAKGDPEAERFVEELPSLPVGDFFCWSPQWLDCFKRLRVHPKTTYDASSTPTLEADGGSADAPAPLAAPDLEALRALLAGARPAPSRARGEPGPEVNAGNAEQEAEIARLIEQGNELERHGAELEAAHAELAGAQAELETRFRTLAGRLEQTTALLGAAIGDAQSVCRELEALSREAAAEGAAVRPPTALAPPAPPPSLPSPAPAPRPQGRAPLGGDGAPPPRANGSGQLGRCELAIVGALFHRGPSSTIRAALLAGYKHSGGGFRNSLSSLRTAGMLTGSATVALTSTGRRAGARSPVPPIGAALLERWCAELGACERVILTVMVRQVRTRAIPAANLASLSKNPATGKPYEVNGGGFRNSLSTLRGLGLIEGGQSGITLGAHIAKDLLS